MLAKSGCSREQGTYANGHDSAKSDNVRHADGLLAVELVLGHDRGEANTAVLRVLSLILNGTVNATGSRRCVVVGTIVKPSTEPLCSVLTVDTAALARTGMSCIQRGSYARDDGNKAMVDHEATQHGLVRRVGLHEASQGQGEEAPGPHSECNVEGRRRSLLYLAPPPCFLTRRVGLAKENEKYKAQTTPILGTGDENNVGPMIPRF